MPEQPIADSAPQLSVEERLAAWAAPDTGDAPSNDEPQQEVRDQQAAPDAEPAPDTGDEPGTEPGMVEYEIDGETYQLPVTLKSKLEEWKEGGMKAADYTRKTQELAEMHRYLQQMAETAELGSKFQENIKEERSQLDTVRSQLAAFKSLDWNSLDAEVGQKLFFQREQLKEQARELEGKIAQKGDEFARARDAHRRQVIQQGQRYLAQTIKGWGPDAAKAVNAAASEVGYTPEELESVLDVRFVRLAHKAAQWDRLQSTKMESVRAAKKAPPVLRPGPGSGQRAAAEAAFKNDRAALKKSGSIQDAARLLAKFGR